MEKVMDLKLCYNKKYKEFHLSNKSAEVYMYMYMKQVSVYVLAHVHVAYIQE